MKFYNHPSYNGYAGSVDYKKKKYKKKLKQWEKEFNERGFDETALWSFDHTLVSWIVPRLERFTEISKEFHNEPELHKDLDKMLKGFKLMISEDFNDLNKKQVKKVQKAFDLLAKRHWSLWW